MDLEFRVSLHVLVISQPLSVDFKYVLAIDRLVGCFHPASDLVNDCHVCRSHNIAMLVLEGHATI